MKSEKIYLRATPKEKKQVREAARRLSQVAGRPLSMSDAVLFAIDYLFKPKEERQRETAA